MRLTDDRLREFRERATKASAGRWGAWGMSLLTGEPGMNEDTATPLASFHTTDEHGRPRTFDLDHAVNMQPSNAIALIDEVLALRKAKRDLVEALRFTREYVGPGWLPPIEGWSWYDALREHAPEVLAAMEAHVTQPEPDPHLLPVGRGHTQVLDPDHGWVDAEPLGMQGWKGKAEERFREYGWTRLANLMARWDERGLGK